jgi:hypothetical protein
MASIYALYKLVSTFLAAAAAVPPRPVVADMQVDVATGMPEIVGFFCLYTRSLLPVLGFRV